MRIFTIAVVACGALLLGGQRSQAGTLFLSNLNQVTAFAGNTAVGNADASHGFLSGNDLSPPTLLDLLNNSSAPIEVDMWDGPPANSSNLQVFISENGMFGSTATFSEDLSTIDSIADLASGQTVDSLQGVKIETTQAWDLVGTTNMEGNQAQGGPFTSFVNQTSGTLILDVDASYVPLFGTYVLALKAGGAYAVYAFQDLQGVTSFHFDFGTTFGEDLSHASLYYGGGHSSVVPEPSSWAIFGLAAIGMVWTVARRRNQLAPQLA